MLVKQSSYCAGEKSHGKKVDQAGRNQGIAADFSTRTTGARAAVLGLPALVWLLEVAHCKGRDLVFLAVPRHSVPA